MKTYKLTGKVTISVYTEAEAETLEKAIKTTQDRSIEAYEYKGSLEKYAWVSDEYDGEVFDIREE